MNLLNVQNLSMSFGDHVIFDDVDFAIDEGEKVALMGPNGVGKTTLFRILIGQYQPDAGTIALQTDLRIGHLSQQSDLADDATPRKMVAQAVSEVRRLIAEYEALSASMGAFDPHAQAGALNEAIVAQDNLRRRIETSGGWDWQRRIDEVLGRLGLAEYIDTPLKQLSGGQRRRVALARTLIEVPDLLLMDEPTNHLDPDAVDWLESWLRQFPGGVLLITHDRYFLEQIADRIIEATPRGLYSHPGTYQEFITRKLKRIEVERTTRARNEKSLDDEFDWLQRGVKARARTSKSRLDEVERALSARRFNIEQHLDIPIANGPSMGPHLISARGIYKGFVPQPAERRVDPAHLQHLPKQTLIEDVSISVVPGDKIGIVGPNGCGKSTLLKILTGQMRFDAGTVEVDEQTRIGYLDQSDAKEDAEMQVYEAFGESDYVWIGETKFHKRDYLGRFLFDNALLKSPVKLLSGGQFRRLRLAQVIAENANLLVLDEPTNDLDIESLRALEEALTAYKGCILVVSHDRYFLNTVCNSICAFEDKKLVRYWGNYDNYREKRDAAPGLPGTPKAAQKIAPLSSPPSVAPTDDGPKKLTWKENKRLEELEAEIDTCETKIAKVEAALADPDLYAKRPEQVVPLNREHYELHARLEVLFEEWQELEVRRG